MFKPLFASKLDVTTVGKPDYILEVLGKRWLVEIILSQFCLVYNIVDVLI